MAQALAAERPWSPLELHALLYRLLSPHARALRDLLHRSEWTFLSASIEYEEGRKVELPGWVEGFLRQSASYAAMDLSRLLINCSAVLQVLDRRHAESRASIQLQSVRPPAPLGCEALFLPRPQSPWDSWIPEDKRLVRGSGDYGHHLPSLLDLQWSVLWQRNLQVEITRLPALPSEILAARLANHRDLRIALASPFSDLEFTVQGEPGRCVPFDGIPYRFLQLSRASLAEGRATLTSLLDACRDQRIDVLCFPELTLDGDLLQELRDQLQVKNDSWYPALVLAGSFHFDSPEGRFNVTQLLDGHGQVVLRQEKCTPFRIPSEQARELGVSLPGFLLQLGIDERGGYEDIRLGGVLRLLESPLGRIAMPICLDYFGDELRDLFLTSGSNLFLVPAMTREMRPFAARAHELGTFNRAVTFVVNSSWLLKQLQQPLTSENLRLSYLPARKLKPQTAPGEWAVFSIREQLGLP